jgi:23S rRNA (adenine2503-C2)-methyltransferase
MINLYDLSFAQLTSMLLDWNYSTYHSELLWRNLYQNLVTDFADMPELRDDLREVLAKQSTLIQPALQLSVDSVDGKTRKFLLNMADGQTIETVQMQYRDRYTACISSQAGCAMGCVFCATGQMGFRRHLTAGEIVGQVLFVNRQLATQGAKLRNIVLMGMGEPLHNYEATMTAIEILTDHKGLAIAPRHITLSTVGVPDKIRQLADDDCSVNLAVSLHAATDAERIALVPPAKNWTLAVLMEACRYYVNKRGKRIFFEWALIAGKNDTPAQAHAVGQLLQGMDAHLNVIPLNPTNGYNGAPSNREAVQAFQHILGEYGIPSTVRQRRGIDIAAGCGQLQTKFELGLLA